VRRARWISTRSLSGIAVALLGCALALVQLTSCASTPNPFDSSAQAQPLIEQGARAFEAADFIEAGNTYRDALKIDPTSAPALAGLGDVYMAQGKLKEGLKYAQAAITADKKDYHGWATLGSGLIDSDELDRAETALRRAISLNPKDADSLGNLGVVFYRQGFMNMAADYFQKAIAIDREEAGHWANLAAATWWLGDVPKAKDYADKALAIDDANGIAHQYRAAAALNADDKEMAIEHSRLAVKDAGEDAWSWSLLANAYANKLEWTEAEKAGTEALRLDSGDVRALGVLAFVQLKQHKYADAIRWANRAIEDNDGDADSYYTLGMAQHALGHLDLAIAAMTQAVQLDPTDAINKRELARFNAEKKRARAKIKRLEAQIAAAKRALAAQRTAAATRRAVGNATQLVAKALAYVRSAYSWRGAHGSLVSWEARKAVVRVSATGKGWTNIYLHRENNGMWTVQEME
jgi:tetratricopeptide (TPR) repeat protein